MEKSIIQKLFLLFACAITALQVSAYNFKVGDLCYNIESATSKTVTVTYENSSPTLLRGAGFRLMSPAPQHLPAIQ